MQNTPRASNWKQEHNDGELYDISNVPTLGYNLIKVIMLRGSAVFSEDMAVPTTRIVDWGRNFHVTIYSADNNALIGCIVCMG